MTKIFRTATAAIIAMTVLGAIALVVFFYRNSHTLPVLGEPDHVAGEFSFTNQDGQTVTEQEVKDKIQVAEYFFTTCPGICKVMNNNLTQVYQALKGHDDFVILSHTVNPETDSVAVLKAYAQKLKANAPSWQFLTGNKEELYRMARQEYLLALEDTVNANNETDFIHTEYVALLDKSRRIRGFYDATNEASVHQMIKDIRILMKEE